MGLSGGDSSILRNLQGALSGAPSYLISDIGYTGYATPQDMFVIRGSATKRIIITQLYMRPNATVSTSFPVSFGKRSTLDTGGTKTSPTPVPLDSRFPAATGALDVYTALPALGALVGYLDYVKNAVPVLTGNSTLISAGNALIGANNVITSYVILNNANESFFLSANGGALPGGFSSSYTAAWSEI